MSTNGIRHIFYTTSLNILKNTDQGYILLYIIDG